MSTSWWREREGQGITKVSRNHSTDNERLLNKTQGSLSEYCLGISVWTRVVDQPTDPWNQSESCPRLTPHVLNTTIIFNGSPCPSFIYNLSRLKIHRLPQRRQRKEFSISVFRLTRTCCESRGSNRNLARIIEETLQPLSCQSSIHVLSPCEEV